MESKYAGAKQTELTMTSLKQEFKKDNFIAEYLTTADLKSQLPKFDKNPTEQQQWAELNTKAKKLAYIIHNSPDLHYQAKALPEYNKITDHAALYVNDLAFGKEMAMERDLN